MGSDGWNPRLQVGGVHDAITDAPPGVVVETVPAMVVVAPLPLTATEVGSEDVHVKGIPVITLFKLSVTAAVIVSEAPCASVSELLLLPFTESVMDWTGQVMKSKGTLFTPPTLANVELIPGRPAFAST